MSDFQFIAGSLPVTRYIRNRNSDKIPEYRAEMREKPRSDYGARLVQARKHAGFTQIQLAKEVGMSQSALGEAETTGSGSTYTPQLAKACRVSADWLATGQGEMFSTEDWPFSSHIKPEHIRNLSHKDLEYVEELVLRLSRVVETPTSDDSYAKLTVPRANSALGTTVKKPEFLSDEHSESEKPSRKAGGD